MFIGGRYYDDRRVENRRPSSRLEAFLVYNGAPDLEDDPADYYIYPRGVRIA